LPEAGFLSALLPMAAGAGLAAMGMPAGYAALAVGATSAATNGGDLRKGLMNGISAYGGAGMAESFMGAGAAATMGTSTAAAPATTLATPPGATSPYALTGSSATPSTASYSLGEPSGFGNKALPSLVSTAPAEVAQAAAQATPAAQAAQQAASLDTMNMGQRWDALKAGASGTNAMNYIKANPLTSLGVASAMLTPDENKTPQKAADTDRGPRAGLSYHPGWTNPMPKPNMQGIEQTYNRPYYAAEGGLMSLARGGRTRDSSKQYDDVQMSPAMQQLLAQQDRSLREIQRLKAQQAGTPREPINEKQLFADYLGKVASGGGTGGGTGGGGTGSGGKYDWWQNQNNPIPTPAIPETPEQYAARMSLNARGGGGGGKGQSEGAPGEGFNPTSEGAYAVSQLGQGLSNISPFLGGAVGAYGNYLAKNVDPNYSHEARHSLNTPVQTETPYGPAEAARDEAARDPANWNDAPVSAAEREASQQTVDSVGKSARASEFGGQSTGFTDGSYTTSLSLPSYAAGDESKLAGDIKDGTVKSGDSVSFDGKQYKVNETNGSINLTLGTQEGPAALSFPAPASDAVAQTNAALTPTETQADRIKRLAEAPESESQAQRLMNENIDVFGPVTYSAADEADRMFAAPYVPGAISAEADTTPNVGAEDKSKVAQISPEAIALTNAALTSAGLANNSATPFSPLAATPTGTYYNNSMAGDRGFVGTGGFGNVWRSVDGTPITTGDGSSLQTGQGAQQESSNDKVNRIIREAQIAAGEGTFGEGTPPAADSGFSMAQFGTTPAAPPAPTQDPAQQQQAAAQAAAQAAQQAAAEANAAAAAAAQAQANDNSATSGGWTGGGGRNSDGGDGGNAASNAAAQTHANDNSATSGGWFGGGSNDARGGYLKNGQFDQRMAHGGNVHGAMRPPPAFFQNGKYSFHPPQMYADGGLPNPYDLGSYSDGGRLLKGPGDGVSDSIPATIGKGRPARLADGEFVIPARIVSEIGNGSTDAGARKLYAMMDRIQAGRKKSVGKGRVAVNSRADKYLPA
jgi:hypothetical protein